jgi:hypothetical protein
MALKFVWPMLVSFAMIGLISIFVLLQVHTKKIRTTGVRCFFDANEGASLLKISAAQTDTLNFSSPEFTKEHVFQALGWKMKQAELLIKTNEEYLSEVADLRAKLATWTDAPANIPLAIPKVAESACARGWEAIPHSKDARFALSKGGGPAPRMNGTLILNPSPSTRWSSTFSSKVNLHHAINFRALRGANFVT